MIWSFVNPTQLEKRHQILHKGRLSPVATAKAKKSITLLKDKEVRMLVQNVFISKGIFHG